MQLSCPRIQLKSQLDSLTTRHVSGDLQVVPALSYWVTANL